MLEQTSTRDEKLGPAVATREARTVVTRSLRPSGDRTRSTDDESLREAIRSGNETAFEALLTRFSPSMLRVARSLVADRETAEEVVQETWLAVIKGIERFEGRSSMKTWIFSILTNRARTRARREWRSRPFSSICEEPGDTERLAVEANKFSDDRHGWLLAQNRWRQTPEDQLLSRETVNLVAAQLREMPSRQAAVVVMRDVHGFTAAEVCGVLGLTESNQRVLLHRGRACIRKAIDLYEHRSVCA